MELLEAMETCRAIRRLKQDPVPDELLEQLIYYATRAPNAGNSQLWDFLVVTGEEDRAFLGELFRTSWGRVVSEGWGQRRAEATTGVADARPRRTVSRLVAEFERVPAVVFTCVRNGYPAADPNEQFMWSTIYPATQNLLLAARGLGLGAVMTTLHLAAEEEVRAHFGIPEEVRIGATVPVGYPAGRYGPVSRKPVVEVMHWGRWAARRP
jgi:nitroreductase